MTFLAPRVTQGSYVSYFFSGWNALFRDWGYPLLDVVQHEDGEWGIIQAHTMPVIPCQTPWSWVVMPMRHRELSPWLCKRYVENLDMDRREFWEEEERREKAMELEEIRKQLHIDEMERRMFNAVRQNPDLMERIARNGLHEMSLRAISRRIPNSRFRKATKKKESPHGNHATVRDRP